MCTSTPPNPALGTLSKLPTEIIFKILDDILYSEPRLTHKTLCTIRQLTMTNKGLANLINYGWLGQKAFDYLQESANAVVWHLDSDHAYEYLTERGVTSQTIMPITGPKDGDPDLLTGIIFDDCTECFEWFSSVLPPTLMTCCNEGGWSFLSLALHSKSQKLLTRFFSAGYPYEPSDFILDHANALETGPTNLGIAASAKDHVSFARLMVKLEEVLTWRGFRKNMLTKLTGREVAAIKSVAPASLRALLYRAGLMISTLRARHSPYYDGRSRR
ncbi:hypothetical protein N7535_005642 [Penicillium sp. DV-2018c]|jgi:hypothetical protein|nr:hypothetical protein N7461_009216 [Penicillium sp. DV-2018c]KAJ5571982.1 hypothetical protein N7535_005642 [Penicillium sp. DV-2018c]